MFIFFMFLFIHLFIYLIIFPFRNFLFPLLRLPPVLLFGKSPHFIVFLYPLAEYESTL